MNPTPVLPSNSKIAVCQSNGKGLGVFALRHIAMGELIEIAPVLLIPACLDDRILEAEISNYIFEWEKEDMAIALGYGSFYNHSYSPNAKYEVQYHKGLIEFVAVREIEEGDEININYNGNPDDTSQVWFDVLE